MTSPAPEPAPLPSWFADALLAAHLGSGDGLGGPGPVEEALVRVASLCLAGITMNPEDERRQGAIFRGWADPAWPGPARVMLGTILDAVATDPEAEDPRRDAALLALTLLVVLEGEDETYRRLRRSHSLAQSLAARRANPPPKGKGRLVTLGPGCRPLLLRLLSSGPGPFDPAVFDLARDVADGVRPGSDQGGFLAEHRALVRACAARMDGAPDEEADSPDGQKAARVPEVGLDERGYLTYNGVRWAISRVGRRQDVPVGKIRASERALYLARLLYFLEQRIHAPPSDRICMKSWAISHLRRACTEAGGALRIEGRKPHYTAKGRVRLTPDLRLAIENRLPHHLRKK